ncbi:MAG: hypothetical protein ACR2P1_20160 [Pseudomonadales bacterium]
MAKILVEDRDEQTKVPFLRGILTRSLQDAGLTFEDAFHLATEVRSDLDDTTLISTDDLHRMIVKRLKALNKDSVVVRYQQHNLPFTLRVQRSDGQLQRFSRLQYQNDLETIGLEGDEAANFVAALHKHLSDKRMEQLTSKHLSMLTYRYLRQSRELGPAVAKRWLVWRDFVNSGRALIFLIGGTAGCGKSSIATMLASRLDIVRTQSTDMLREVMRTMLPEQLLPVIHKSSFTAWQALPGQEDKTGGATESLLINGYRSQADLLSVAIEAVIARTLRENVSLILEGVHVQPEIVEKLQPGEDATVIPIMLAVLKHKVLRQRIQGRGSAVRQRRADRYLKSFDEIWGLQSYLLSEADRANIPIVANDDRDKVFREIMRITINTLAENFDNTPEAVFG